MHYDEMSHAELVQELRKRDRRNFLKDKSYENIPCGQPPLEPPPPTLLELLKAKNLAKNLIE